MDDTRPDTTSDSQEANSIHPDELEVPETCYCDRTGCPTSIDDVTSSLPFDPSTDRVLAIFGSRGYARDRGAPEAAAVVVDELSGAVDVDDPAAEIDAVVSGGADGADDVAEVVGIQLGVPVLVLNVGSPAEQRHSIRRELAAAPFVVETVATYDGPDDDPRSGSGAYLWRNCLIAEIATDGLAIWDGDSRGTQHAMVSCLCHDTSLTRLDC